MKIDNAFPVQIVKRSCSAGNVVQGNVLRNLIIKKDIVVAPDGDRPSA